MGEGGQETQTSYKINLSLGDVIYSLVTIVNNIALHI